MRLTIACPEPLIPLARHLAMALGYSPADADTYRVPAWEDAFGNRHACASLIVGPAFISTATSALARPAWDEDGAIDMDAAAQAQGLVRLWVPSEEYPTPPLASPDVITAVGGMEGVDALVAMGLTALNNDGPTLSQTFN